MKVLRCADANAPYRAEVNPATTGEGWEVEEQEWRVLDKDNWETFGGLAESEARRLAACLNYCKRLTTEQIEEKVRLGRIPLK